MFCEFTSNRSCRFDRSMLPAEVVPREQDFLQRFVVIQALAVGIGQPGEVASER